MHPDPEAVLAWVALQRALYAPAVPLEVLDSIERLALEAREARKARLAA